MARPSRRRPAAAVAQPAATAPINSFLKVSKSTLPHHDLAAKKNIALFKPAAVANEDKAPAATTVLLPITSRKRRAADDSDDNIADSIEVSIVLPTRTKARLPKRSCRPEDHAIAVEKGTLGRQSPLLHLQPC